MNAVGEGANAALRARPPQPQIIATPETSPAVGGNASAPANATAPAPAADPDASPASAPPKPKSQPSSPPPEPAEDPAKPVEPVKDGTAPTTAPTPAPSLSPVVVIEEPPKDVASAVPADGVAGVETAAKENEAKGKQASDGGEGEGGEIGEIGEGNGEGSSSPSTDDGENRLVKKGEQNLDGV